MFVQQQQQSTSANFIMNIQVLHSKQTGDLEDFATEVAGVLWAGISWNVLLASDEIPTLGGAVQLGMSS